MTDVQARIREFIARALDMLPVGARDGAWWTCGTRLYSDLVTLGLAYHAGSGHWVLEGLPVEWVPGDRVKLMAAPGAAPTAIEPPPAPDPLEAVPVAFAWTCPRRGRMMATDVAGRPPWRLDDALPLLPHPTVDEARRIFGKAFGQGLRDAVRSMGHG